MRILFIGLPMAALLAASCTTKTTPTSALGSESPRGTETAFVRIDQVGYAPDEIKQAYFMSAADIGGVHFEVKDDAGRTAFAGEAGASTGAWNGEFRNVRVLDFSPLPIGTYRIVVPGALPSHTFRVAPAAELFGAVVEANIRFFQAQRDGADVIPSVLRRKPAHLNDRRATVYETPRYDESGGQLLDERLTAAGGPVDVSGGWFDAGDFLKFTHTAAYSVAALLLAQRDAQVGGAALAGETRHGMDWLDRMWDETTGTLYAQVGIGAGNDNVRTDHDYWRLPEDDEASGADPALAHRPLFRAAAPGAPISPNLAGKVAAAFALAAQLDTGASARRKLDKAARLYARADRHHTGTLITAYPHAFYPENSWHDDMEFAATELAWAAKALGDPRAAQWGRDAGHWAAAYLASDVQGTLGVGDVSALAHADLIRLLDAGATTDETNRGDLVRDLARQLDTGRGHADRDPFRAGADYTDFDSVPHTFGLATTARLYQRATGTNLYAAFGTRQRNWALGANAWGSSFVIGAGAISPRCPEHQAANLTGEELTGAAVNGPNKAEKFKELNTFPTMRACSMSDFARFDGQGARYLDDVGAWQSVEPADDFTATALLYFALAAAAQHR